VLGHLPVSCLGVAHVECHMLLLWEGKAAGKAARAAWGAGMGCYGVPPFAAAHWCCCTEQPQTASTWHALFLVARAA
jgi:hypothetical protein